MFEVRLHRYQQYDGYEQESYHQKQSQQPHLSVLTAARLRFGFSYRALCKFFGRYAAAQIVEKVALLVAEAKCMVEAARAAVEEIHRVVVLRC